MAIKTIDTENITPEMLAELGSSYLFEDENWRLAAIKAVLDAAPAVESAPVERESVRATLEEIAAEEENVKIRQIHIIDAETRAMVLELCDAACEHVKVWTYPYGTRTLELAKQIREQLEKRC